MRKVSKMTMYIDTTVPRDLLGAISERYSGATTVKPPAPKPLHNLENSRNLRMPEEKVVMSMPVIQRTAKACHVRSRPMRSVMAMAMRAPMAAPSTPKDEMLALRDASSSLLPFHCDLVRPKSRRKE